jgi:hypothetical protein
MTPMLTDIAKGQLCTASPSGRRCALRREFPAVPPQGGEASLWAALRKD